MEYHTDIFFLYREIAFQGICQQSLSYHIFFFLHTIGTSIYIYICVRIKITYKKSNLTRQGSTRDIYVNQILFLSH